MQVTDKLALEKWFFVALILKADMKRINDITVWLTRKELPHRIYVLGENVEGYEWDLPSASMGEVVFINNIKLCPQAVDLVFE